MVDKKAAYSIIGASVIAAFYAAVLVQILSLSADPTVSKDYLSFYIFAGLTGLVWIGLSMFWILVNHFFHDNPVIRLIAPFGWLASSNDDMTILGNWSLRSRLGLFLILALVLSIGNLFANMNSQTVVKFYPTTSFYTNYAVNPTYNLYLSSVPVGLFEDITFNFFTPYALYSAEVLFLVYVLKVSVERLSNKLVIFALITVACLITSSGLNWLIPGFSSAHSAYINNLPAQESTFIFGFIASEFNLVTGVFGSWIAHAVHNYLVTGRETGVIDTIGPAAAAQLVNSTVIS